MALVYCILILDLMRATQQLKKTLSPFALWALGVGYVISGMYFGWNLGLEKGGTLGMAVATITVMFMYIAFTLSYTELACAIPKAGGVFDYANKALGKDVAFIAGIAQTVEFVFAPPAIAFAIGAYFNAFYPAIPILSTAIFAYLIFTTLNIIGVKAAAIFEIVVTVLAVGELLLFVGIAAPSFETENLARNALPHSWSGAFAAIPFAIWFFLGVEGIANVAEETKNPQRDIQKGFGWAIATLCTLCVLVFFTTIGVAGWEAVVFKNGIDGETSDSPLPLALYLITGDNHLLYHLLITVGLFGLIASFHGLILAAGRSTYEMGKAQNFPPIFGKISKKFQTPSYALVGNMVVGIVALLSGKTGEIIILAVFGALTLYIIAMIAMIRLRNNAPDMERPFRAPLYPIFPISVIAIGSISLLSMFYFSFKIGFVYLLIIGFSYILFKTVKR